MSCIADALKSNNPKALALALKLAKHPVYKFKPRPDQPHLLDQQASFFNDRFDGIACVVAGNGSGKTYTGSAKVASFLLTTPPPEKNSLFWVLSKTIDMAAGNCWAQNLSKFIPVDHIHDVVWYSKSKGHPKSIILKPNGNGNNFMIEFKSYDMDRQALQAANVAGYWLDEQAPFDIHMEVFARTRKWSFPGSKLYTLTPLEPDQKLEEIFQDPPPSWRFYRMNTRVAAKAGHVTDTYVKQLEENEIAELAETRMSGQFAHYEGAVYKNFDVNLHVIKPIDLPKNWLRLRGLDLGWQHYTACIWAAKDLQGRYYVYHEYFENKTSVEDHVKAINDGWLDNPVRGNTYADPASAQVLHEFALRGLSTVPAQKDVLAGIATVQTLLRPGEDGKPMLLIFDTCRTLINQMRSYVYDPKTGKPKKESATYLMDGADALRYLCHSHKIDSSIEYKPLKQPERTRKINF